MKKLSIIATTAILALTSVLCVYAATNSHSSEPCSCDAEVNYICGGIKVGTEYADCDCDINCQIYYGYPDCTITKEIYQTYVVCTECGQKWIDYHTHVIHSLCPHSHGCPFSSAIASVSDIAD